MTNKTAIKEIEKIKCTYYELCEYYFSNFSRKEAKEISEKKIFVKIDALNMALDAIKHIENITNGGKR